MLNRLFVVDSVTLTSTGTAVSSYTPWDQTTRKLPTQVVVKATGQGAYVRLSNDNSAATNADVLVQGGDHVVLSVQGRRWVSVLSDGASSTVNVGALSTGVSGSAASLDLAFVDAGVLDPRVTFTRASTATYFNSAGVLTSAAINESRRDFDPATLAVRGLLIEEQRTNSIRNNTMQGAVAGTPGTLPTNWAPTTSTFNGITRTIVGTGIENGITYIDIQYAGTAAANGNINISADQNNFIAALQNQVWTFSAYFRLVGGSFANLTTNALYINSYTSGGAFDANATSVVSNYAPTGSALNTQRYFLTGTLSSATTAFVNGGLFLTYNNGAVINFTLRIGLPQLELGAFATSVIPTTTTALTRSADVASVNTLSPWYNQTEGTVYAELQSLSPLTAAQSVALNKYPNVWNIESGANDSVPFWYGIGAELIVNGAYNNIGTVPSGINKFAVALAASGGQSRSSLNGAAAVNRNGTLSGTATLFSLGKDSTNNVNNFLNGYLRRLTYYPRALSAAELPVLTA